MTLYSQVESSWAFKRPWIGNTHVLIDRFVRRQELYLKNGPKTSPSPTIPVVRVPPHIFAPERFPTLCFIRQRSRLNPFPEAIMKWANKSAALELRGFVHVSQETQSRRRASIKYERCCGQWKADYFSSSFSRTCAEVYKPPRAVRMPSYNHFCPNTVACRYDL